LLRDADEVLRWESERGGGQLDVFAHVYAADVLAHRAALAEAAVHVDSLLPHAREGGDPQVLVPGLATAALVASARGDSSTAVEYVRELEHVTRADALAFRSACLTWPARIAASAGEPELAEAFLEGSEHPL